jgi:hypothetical protein
MKNDKIVTRTETDRTFFWVGTIGWTGWLLSALIRGEWSLVLALVLIGCLVFGQRFNEWEASTRQVISLAISLRPKVTVSFGDAPAGTICVGTATEEHRIGDDEYVSVTASRVSAPWPPSRSNPSEN